MNLHRPIHPAGTYTTFPALANWKMPRITEVKQVAEGEFIATVLGSMEYNVCIELDEALDILLHDCDCPFDKGPICKHQIAVLYYIRNSELYNAPIDEGMEELERRLQKLEKEELIALFLDLYKRNGRVRRELDEF